MAPGHELSGIHHALTCPCRSAQSGPSSLAVATCPNWLVPGRSVVTCTFSGVCPCGWVCCAWRRVTGAVSVWALGDNGGSQGPMHAHAGATHWLLSGCPWPACCGTCTHATPDDTALASPASPHAGDYPQAPTPGTVAATVQVGESGAQRHGQRPHDCWPCFIDGPMSSFPRRRWAA